MVAAMISPAVRHLLDATTEGRCRDERAAAGTRSPRPRSTFATFDRYAPGNSPAARRSRMACAGVSLASTSHLGRMESDGGRRSASLPLSHKTQAAPSGPDTSPSPSPTPTTSSAPGSPVLSARSFLTSSVSNFTYPPVAPRRPVGSNGGLGSYRRRRAQLDGRTHGLAASTGEGDRKGKGKAVDAEVEEGEVNGVSGPGGADLKSWTGPKKSSNRSTGTRTGGPTSLTVVDGDALLEALETGFGVL